MSASDPLLTFLRARLDEDEKLAQSAAPGPWTLHRHEFDQDRWADISSADEGRDVVTTESGANPPDEATAVHIANFDPARVLRGVDAKRRILNELLPQIAHADELVEREWGSNDDCAVKLARLLASEWSDHPEYRTEWA